MTTMTTTTSKKTTNTLVAGLILFGFAITAFSRTNNLITGTVLDSPFGSSLFSSAENIHDVRREQKKSTVHGERVEKERRILSPRVVKQISLGSVLGLGAGLILGALSRSLTIVFGLGFVFVQVCSSLLQNLRTGANKLTMV